MLASLAQNSLALYLKSIARHDKADVKVHEAGCMSFNDCRNIFLPRPVPGRGQFSEHCGTLPGSRVADGFRQLIKNKTHRGLRRGRDWDFSTTQFGV